MKELLGLRFNDFLTWIELGTCFDLRLVYDAVGILDWILQGTDDKYAWTVFYNLMLYKIYSIL